MRFNSAGNGCRVHRVELSPALARRHFLLGLAGLSGLAMGTAVAQPKRFRIAFANQNEEPGVRLDGLGFTGLDVRRGFELAARTLPVEMVYLDNAGDPDKARANADEAIARKVDLFIAYGADAEANADIGRKLKAAGVPVLAVNYPVPGAPLYTADNLAAGHLAGKALGEFARQSWTDQAVLAAVVGDLGDMRTLIADRVQGIAAGLRQDLPAVVPARLDTGGNPVRAEGLLGKFLAAQPRRKVLIAALDDPTALSAKGAAELAGRSSDCVIVGQGVDRSLHGGASDKKELDPNNRGSIVLGSVAYFLDRYGYEILPLALKMLQGEPIAFRTATKHILITARNIFQIYPPHDMN
jgi:ribose transport system substrate-binding protein